MLNLLGRFCSFSENGDLYSVSKTSIFPNPKTTGSNCDMRLISRTFEVTICLRESQRRLTGALKLRKNKILSTILHVEVAGILDRTGTILGHLLTEIYYHRDDHDECRGLLSCILTHRRTVPGTTRWRGGGGL